MPLVLGLKVGQSFTVLRHTITISEIKSIESFVLSVKNVYTKKEQAIFITSTEFIEVLDKVFVTSGFGSSNQAKVLIKAPRYIKIRKNSSWKVMPDVRRVWKDVFPEVPYTQLFALVEQAVDIGADRCVYGRLEFTVIDQHKIVNLVVKGSAQVCTFCYGTKVVPQWDDDEQRLRQVPCNC